MIGAAGDEIPIGSVPQSAVPCRQITAAALAGGLAGGALAALLSVPTIVTGLIDAWPASSWLSEMAFDNVDPTKLSHAARHARTNAQEELYGKLQRDYAVPDALRRASTWRVLSYGLGMTGVHITPNHGFAWLGLVNGSKTWYLAPSTMPVPDEFGCARKHVKCSTAWKECMVQAAGCTHTCRQATRDVVVVPTGWWHATCNAGDGEPTVGIGGQDRCGVIENGVGGCRLRIPPSARLLNQQGVSSVCPDVSRDAACHGAIGRAADAEMEPRLLQPDLQVAGTGSGRLRASRRPHAVR